MIRLTRYPFCAGVLLLLTVMVGAQELDDRPNILVFMAEDLGTRVGAFGDAHAVTPAIDDLAAMGVRYTSVFTTAGVCAPSRAAHIMGKHQIAFGAQHMRTSSFEEASYLTVPPPELKAYPELLRQAGYFTFTVRKLDYQFSTPAPGSGPFTIWNHESRDFDLDAIDPERPFFGLINMPQTHESQLFDDNVAKNRAAGLERTVSPDAVDVPDYYPDIPAVREAIARQYDNVAAMDRYLAGMLARLRQRGLLENTIIVWTTDHGDGLPRAKRELYDGGIHVPMVIVWPERHRPAWVEPGGVYPQLVSFVDFGPRFLALDGVPVPESMGGRPVLVDRTAERDYVYAEKDRLDEYRFRERAVRDARFKYIRNLMPGRPGATHLAYRDRLAIMAALWERFRAGELSPEQSAWFEPRPAEALYDTHADPDEVNNLADDPAYKDVLERMRSALNAWLRRTPDWSDMAEIDMARSMWPDGTAPVTPPPEVRRISASRFALYEGVPGASLAWRVPGDDWQVVYPGEPIEAGSGAAVIVKSVRYGWRESDEAELKLDNVDNGT
ncbi:MAG: sulfatase [Woeseiaceae bacterium]